MAKESPIPKNNTEWPEWEYRQFPAWVGRDENGADLIAKDKDEAKEMSGRKVYPKVLGVDAKGNEVVALDPKDETRKKGDVADKPAAKPEKVAPPAKSDGK